VCTRARFSFPLCQPRAQSKGRSGILRSARAPPPQQGNSSAKRSTTFVEENMAHVRRSRRSRSASPRHGEPVCRSSRRDGAARRRRPNGRPPWPTRRDRAVACLGRLRRDVDGPSRKRSNGRGGRQPRRKRSPGRRARPRRGGPAPIARTPPNGRQRPRGRAGAPLPPGGRRPPANATATDHPRVRARLTAWALARGRLHVYSGTGSGSGAYHLIAMSLGLRPGISQ
jgi:hypothetical protein